MTYKDKVQKTRSLRLYTTQSYPDGIVLRCVHYFIDRLKTIYDMWTTRHLKLKGLLNDARRYKRDEEAV